jgi:hypothetical protein
MQEVSAPTSPEEVEQFGRALGANFEKFSDQIHYRKFVMDVIDGLTEGLDPEQLFEISEQIRQSDGNHSRAEKKLDPADAFADFM